jgi:hypothetical protein
VPQKAVPDEGLLKAGTHMAVEEPNAVPFSNPVEIGDVLALVESVISPDDNVGTQRDCRLVELVPLALQCS